MINAILISIGSNFNNIIIPVGNWILALGSWNDSGVWVDSDVWKDS